MRTIRRTRPIERDVVAEDAVVHRDVERAPWSPAQIVSLAVGMFLAVVGGVALARTGIDFSNLAETHTAVAGMHHTALLGLMELIVGLVLIGAGALPGAGRGTMTFTGVLLLGFGLVVMIQPSSFHTALGAHAGNGLVLAFLGAVLLIAAMVAPVVFDTDRRVVSRSSDVSGGTWQ